MTDVKRSPFKVVVTETTTVTYEVWAEDELQAEDLAYLASIDQTVEADSPYFGTVHIQRENPAIQKVSAWPKDFQC